MLEKIPKEELRVRRKIRQKMYLSLKYYNPEIDPPEVVQARWEVFCDVVKNTVEEVNQPWKEEVLNMLKII